VKTEELKNVAEMRVYDVSVVKKAYEQVYCMKQKIKTHTDNTIKK